ncbi:MAG: hypothetical protein ACTSO3_11755 [Candidatus Heimdallarchaeaceae archaeon]
MATGYVINIGTASAKQWLSFSYEKTLNGMSNCQIALDGVTSGYSSEFDVDSDVSIYKNGTLKFKGIVTGQDSMSAGGIVLTCLGIENELVDDKCPMVGSNLVRTFTSTTDNSIISTLVTSISGWTVDVSNSSAITPASFRVSASESVWNAVIRLIEQVGKDIWIDQENKKVYLYDELTTDDQFSFIEGKNATGIKRSKGRSLAGKVIVYGKGDGDFQIVGSSGASTPVHTIIDRNIVSDTEADARALIEYNKLNPQLKRYNFVPTTPVDSLEIGDSGNISNNSAGINEEVDIVRIKISVNNKGIEKINIEVTNPDFRIASKNSAEASAKSQSNYNQSQSSMQGSGNTQSWARGINAKLDTPLTIPFFVSNSFVTDEAGNIRVDSMTLDYDVDPFRRGVGSASETNKAPDFDDVSKTALHGHSPYETGSGHDHTNPATVSAASGTGGLIGTDTYAENVSASWDLVASVNYSGTYGVLWAEAKIEADGWSGTDEISVQIEGLMVDCQIPINTAKGALYKYYIVPMFGSVSGDIDLSLFSRDANNYKGHLKVYGDNQSHTHNINSYNTNDRVTSLDDSNEDPAVTGKTDLHAHDVSVGDDVSDAGSVNASEVDIYLDFWNTGTSNWDNKHSILNTGKTLDTDVDITDSNTYPDATGFWRVRINPDNASPDLVQGIVKMKFAMDN